MVEKLVQFFLRPGGSALRAQVIQHQKRGIANFFKPFVVGGDRGRAKSRPKMIQQIWHHDEQGWAAVQGLLVGDGRRQMRFCHSHTAR